jgi:hypothetical protein
MLCAAACALGALDVAAAERVLSARLHHLRSGNVREWADFPDEAEGAELRLTFVAESNSAEQTLRLRQRDVKQTWKLRLNDTEIGRLPPDENDMATFWAVPANILKAGENTLMISADGKEKDDILIGDVRLDDRPRREVLAEANVDVSVTEAGDAVPCRLTIVDANGSLMTPGLSSDERHAVRPGVIYTADGRARFGLPAGRYTLYAGRGFEYSVASSDVVLEPGQSATRRLALRREVPTEGLIACDTHVHTLTLSGHGDATLAERVVTVAGEGIELPIATDHNVHADYNEAARAAGVRGYFSPVTGNEVTTPRMGHFNIFPIAPGAPVVDQNAADWPKLFAAIHDCPRVSVVVFNHPRDLHGGFRPFGPEHHLGPIGENLDDWKLEANALEVVNSGALQRDGMQLIRDWFGMINRGFGLAPVGASDSHDVARYFVGQGRTYIRGDDRDPGRIDVIEACKRLAQGRVFVSLGLLCEMTVADAADGREYGPGDLVTGGGELDVSLRVLGPGWSRASHVTLYANGMPVREAEISEAPRDPAAPGVIWTGRWKLPRFRHDVFLAAVATGPGIKELYWPIPRPYQPTTPVWHSYVLGSTGAVWIDADGSGGFAAAGEYAARLVDDSRDDFSALLSRLADYDEAVAAQAARIVHASKIRTSAELLEAAGRIEIPAVREGFRTYIEAWRESEHARAGR